MDTYDAQIITVKAVQEIIKELETQKKLNDELLKRLESLEKKFGTGSTAESSGSSLK